jgi:hypothetical protein
VQGSLTRKGERHVIGVRPGNGPRCQGSPARPSDCGTKAYPAGTTVGVQYLMPAAWTYTSPAPLIPSIVLTGPHQRELWMLPHFTDCPGENLGDAILRGTAGSDGDRAQSRDRRRGGAAHRWSAARGRSRRRPTGR